MVSAIASKSTCEITRETVLALAPSPTLRHAVASPQFMLQDSARSEDMTTHLTG